jgi:hypothetical protein
VTPAGLWARADESLARVPVEAQEPGFPFVPRAAGPAGLQQALEVLPDAVSRVPKYSAPELWLPAALRREVQTAEAQPLALVA